MVNVTNRTVEVDLSTYVPNGEWQLMEKPTIVRSERFYNCCIEPFPEITISLKIRRKTLYYMYNIVFPCMMMSTLTVLVFCLPPDSGEKIGLGVTVLLAFSVFMLAIAEKMPETSESIPILSIYMTSVMTTTCVSVIMTVTVLNFFYRGPTLTHVPVWAQIYILGKSRATATRGGRIVRNRDESVVRRRKLSQVYAPSPADDTWSQIAEKYSLNMLRRHVMRRASVKQQMSSEAGGGQAHTPGARPLRPISRQQARAAAAAANASQESNHTCRNRSRAGSSCSAVSAASAVGNGGVVNIGDAVCNHCPPKSPVAFDDEVMVTTLDAASADNNGGILRRGSRDSHAHSAATHGIDIKIIPPSSSESECGSVQMDALSHCSGASRFLDHHSLCGSSTTTNWRHAHSGGGPGGGGGAGLGGAAAAVDADASDRDLNRIINMMAERQKEDDQISEMLKDWKMLAQKVDSFLFWVFLIVTFLTSFLFIFVLPYKNRGKLL